MASFQSAATITALLSPLDASKLSGRYETVTKTKSGEDVSVLRSLRHAPQKDLMLRARITPKKVQPTHSDIDGLCDLFRSKATVSPKKLSGSKPGTVKKVESGLAETAVTTVKKTNVVSSPVNKRRASGRLSALAARKAILAEEEE